MLSAPLFFVVVRGRLVLSLLLGLRVAPPGAWRHLLSVANTCVRLLWCAGEVRDPIFHGERDPGPIPQDHREERVPGVALGEVSVSLRFGGRLFFLRVGAVNLYPYYVVRTG